jgi:hypothetical protein
LSLDKAFLDHQAAVMRALANLLEYDPAADLSASDPDTQTQHLNAAQAGLSISIQRLNAAPKYANDKTISQLADDINSVEAARGELAAQVGKPEFNEQKQSFMLTVSQIQNQIITNRNNFWASQQPGLFELTNHNETTLHFYLTQLQNI